MKGHHFKDADAKELQVSQKIVLQVTQSDFQKFSKKSVQMVAAVHSCKANEFKSFLEQLDLGYGWCSRTA
jgi:hypothetical protein